MAKIPISKLYPGKMRTNNSFGSYLYEYLMVMVKLGLLKPSQRQKSSSLLPICVRSSLGMDSKPLLKKRTVGSPPDARSERPVLPNFYRFNQFIQLFQFFNQSDSFCLHSFPGFGGGIRCHVSGQAFSNGNFVPRIGDIDRCDFGTGVGAAN